MCMWSCTANSACSMATFKSTNNTCTLYNSIASSFYISSISTATLLQKQLNNGSFPAAPAVSTCIANYWPIVNSLVLDPIGGMNATSTTPQFVTDRFGTLNSAIHVNSAASAWTLPAGSYTQGDFTATLWVQRNICPGPIYAFGIKQKKKSLFFSLLALLREMRKA